MIEVCRPSSEGMDGCFSYQVFGWVGWAVFCYGWKDWIQVLGDFRVP